MHQRGLPRAVPPGHHECLAPGEGEVDVDVTTSTISVQFDEPMNPEVIKVWKAHFGLDIYDFFGQTETVCVLSNYPFMPIRFGSVGKLLKGGEEVLTFPRIAVLRSFIMNHMIHHRGQLTVYLRLLDVPVPALYGPSADETS